MPTFFGPHPGLMGAVIPIPAEVKKVANELNGKRMSLQKAVKKIQAVTLGKVEVVPEYKYISLYLKSAGAFHFFRVIRYR